METSELNFGLRVENLLKERNVKPAVFYDNIGIVPQLFYDWKKRAQAPNARTALKVAQYFGVTVEYLLTGETTNPLQKKVEELQKKLREVAEFASMKASEA